MRIFVSGLILLLIAASGCERRGQSAYESCIAKLTRIRGAKEVWGFAHQKTTNDTPTWVDLSELIKHAPLKCPAGGTYSIGRLDENPDCSRPECSAYWRDSIKPGRHLEFPASGAK
jgi:hypothetical protein